MAGGVAFNLEKLDACFGGFTPMALTNIDSSGKQVEDARERTKAVFEARRKAEELARENWSEHRSVVDESGTQWRYVVMDDVAIRIEKCVSSASFISIPAHIEDLPVVALASDSCADLSGVEEIICPDTILSIGYCAFRRNRTLKKIVFPAFVESFDIDWLRSCTELSHLVLPGCATRINAGLFDLPSLSTLVLGPHMADVAFGTFFKSNLQQIMVDEANPNICTDGYGLYSADKTTLIALAVPVDSYEVDPHCITIAKKAFFGRGELSQVSLPESLETILEFAFSQTGIREIVIPHNVREIKEKAFYNCAKLCSIKLNDGLETIGTDTFSGTGLDTLHIPASVHTLGNPLAPDTKLTYAGESATFSIAPESEHLHLDSTGALYHRADGQLHFVRMMDPLATECVVAEGTVAIDSGAFAKHPNLAHVTFPESLRFIEDRAFKGCMELRSAQLPPYLESVGDEAFLDTNIESIHIPVTLENLGKEAFITHGAHHGAEEPSLKSIQVEPGNTRFSTESGLLLQRKGQSAARVVLYAGSAEEVVIPPNVDEVAPYAFNDARGIRSLTLSDHIRSVGVRGLAVDGLVEHIHFNLDKPVDGRTGFDLYFPPTDRGVQQLMLAMSVPSYVDPQLYFEHYDNAVVNASSFDARSSKGLSLYSQVTRIIARLKDPVFMRPVIKSLCDGILTSGIMEACVEIAKHDDRASIDALIDLGYLNASNINEAIDRVGAVQDAAMTGYLLEQKRLRLNMSALDFDL